MTQNKNLILAFVCLFVAIIALFHFDSSLFGIPFTVATFYFLFASIQQNNSAARAANQEIEATDKQLRANLIAAHNLALAKLGTADQALKTKVVELLVQAGAHLGYPYTNGRVVYGSGYFLNWNKEGLALVDQAQQLILAYKPVSEDEDRGGGEHH